MLKVKVCMVLRNAGYAADGLKMEDRAVRQRQHVLTAIEIHSTGLRLRAVRPQATKTVLESLSCRGGANDRSMDDMAVPKNCQRSDKLLILSIGE